MTSTILKMCYYSNMNKNLRQLLRPYKKAIYLLIIFIGLIIFVGTLAIYSGQFDKKDKTDKGKSKAPESSPVSLPVKDEEDVIITEPELKEYDSQIKFYDTTTTVKLKYDPSWKLEENYDEAGKVKEIMLTKTGYKYYIGIAGEGGGCIYSGNEEDNFGHNSVYEPNSYIDITGVQSYRRQKEPYNLAQGSEISLCQGSEFQGKMVFYNAFGRSLLYVRYQIPENYSEQMVLEMDDITKTLFIK